MGAGQDRRPDRLGWVVWTAAHRPTGDPLQQGVDTRELPARGVQDSSGDLARGFGNPLGDAGPTYQRCQLDVGEQGVEIDLSQEGVRVDPGQQPVDIDPVEQVVDVDAVQEGVEVEVVQDHLRRYDVDHPG